jgi:hypothetical protein
MPCESPAFKKQATINVSGADTGRRARQPASMAAGGLTARNGAPAPGDRPGGTVRP